MDFIVWDESFDVGVKIINAQHKKLFALISKLYVAVNKTEGEAEPLENIILELAAYVDFHFRAEEKYMNEFDCVDKNHFDQHKFYEGKINEFNYKYQRGEEGVGEEILYFLKDWIANHVKIKDKEYTGCFHEHGLF